MKNSKSPLKGSILSPGKEQSFLEEKLGRIDSKEKNVVAALFFMEGRALLTLAHCVRQQNIFETFGVLFSLFQYSVR